MTASTYRSTPSIAMAAALAILVALSSGQTAEAQGAETLILYDHFAGETPESIVFDSGDNAYITLAFTGEIRKIAPDLTQTSLTFLPLGAPCGPVVTVALGLAIDDDDRLFVAVTACDPTNSGIWEVDTETGAIELLANAPSFTVWNGIDVHNGCLYAADTFGGLVWRIPVGEEDDDSDSGDSASGDSDSGDSDSGDSDSDSDEAPACVAGSGQPEIWADDPLLKIAPGSPFPGPNGVQFYRGSVYVANSSTGGIIEIPIENDGTAGQAVLFGSIFPQGCDEFTFDKLGRVYCTTDPFNTILRLSADGTVETLLTAADLLDGPTSVAFGRKGKNRKNLYITNAAFPVFTTTFRPSLMRLRLDVKGDPDEF